MIARMVALAKVLSLMIKEKQESSLSSWLSKWLQLTALALALSLQVIKSDEILVAMDEVDCSTHGWA